MNHVSLIIIDNYLNSDYAEQVYNTITSLEYTPIKFNGEVNYEFGYNINQIVDEIFNNIKFYDLVNQKLSVEVSAIYEHHISKMSQGEYIDDHADKTINGQLATFLFYLNKDWTKEDGGDLEITENVSILPVFNRLVLFNNTETSTHRVNRLKTDKTRYTITGWLHNDRDQNNN
jgi:Rps23 Pro-64 3,4-dihydroxylase Tpa1-like proline 4-hydroxylase